MKAEIYLEEGVLDLDLVLIPETEEEKNAVESLLVDSMVMKVDVTGFGCGRNKHMGVTLSLSQPSTWSKFYPGDKEEV